jgi:hypothetical protein
MDVCMPVSIVASSSTAAGGPVTIGQADTMTNLIGCGDRR